MNISGIVSEYNPIHLGHIYHINETRRLLGEDCGIVCVMSGNFVQRGECAVFTKNARAAAAVRSGADLIVELPLPWAISSARGFAQGAVGILGALENVTHISFGSECGEIKSLTETAKLLASSGLDAYIREELSQGLPYAAARQRAAERLGGKELEALKSPNNILGIEYIMAIAEQGLAIQPVTVPRRGAGHDSREESDILSASTLREMIAAGDSAEGFIPVGASEVFNEEASCGRGPVTMSMLESALISRLRMLPDEAYEALPDGGEGLGRRLCKAARTEPGLTELYGSVKTKRYALSRIRRMVLCATLGVTPEDSRGTPPYIRVLAANERGLKILKAAGERASLPIVTKPGDVRKLDARAQRIFGLETRATDLYTLAFAKKEERLGERDWRISPYIYKCSER